MEPSELTQESIEAMEKEDIGAILSLADALHRVAPTVLATPLPAAELERQMTLRTALKNKLSESMGYLSDQLAELEAMKRNLRTKKGWLILDEQKLESQMFNALRAQKKGNA